MGDVLRSGYRLHFDGRLINLTPTLETAVGGGALEDDAPRSLWGSGGGGAG